MFEMKVSDKNSSLLHVSVVAFPCKGLYLNNKKVDNMQSMAGPPAPYQ